MNGKIVPRVISTPTRPERSARVWLVAISLIISFVAAACGDASPAEKPADTGLPFVTTLTFQIVSNEQQGDRKVIEAEGRGTSDALGTIKATTTVVETLTPECERATEEHVWSMGDGTLDISANVQVCGTEITGIWEVTGGSGKFSAATGGGTETGRFESSGVVIEYEGRLSI